MRLELAVQILVNRPELFYQVYRTPKCVPKCLVGYHEIMYHRCTVNGLVFSQNFQ